MPLAWAGMCLSVQAAARRGSLAAAAWECRCRHRHTVRETSAAACGRRGGADAGDGVAASAGADAGEGAAAPEVMECQRARKSPIL